MEDIPQSPSSLTGSLRGWRPSLVWLFNHVRGEDRDYLTKEDLVGILEGTVDNSELTEAFNEMDKDGDGQIRLDEFMDGFATFLRHARHTTSQDAEEAEIGMRRRRSNSFNRGGTDDEPPSNSRMRPRSSTVVKRPKRHVKELFYESDRSSEDAASSENMQQTLSFLSPQNRQAM